jgi:hypothetical protein
MTKESAPSGLAGKGNGRSMYVINACRLEGDRTLIHDCFLGVTAAIDIHHAKHFIAGFKPGGLGTALFDNSRKVPAQCVRQAVILDGRIFAGPDLEVDGIDAGRAHGNQHLAGVRKRRLDTLGLEDFLAAEMMDAHLRDGRHDQSPWMPINFGPTPSFPEPGTCQAALRFLWKAENGRTSMASETPRQKRITGRVMHEFKHGELKSGRDGKGGKVKSRRQAIAIALEEAGASRYESESRNRRNLRRTEKKEAQGRTGQQEREGTSHVGAYRKRESTRAMAGRDARGTTALVVRPRPPGLASPTAIPGKSFTPRRNGSGSKVAQE